MAEKIRKDQLDRLFDVLDRRFGEDTHGGDILFAVQEASGSTADTYWDLTVDEADRVLKAFGG